MNYYKQSQMASLLSKRLARHNRRNPKDCPTQDYSRVGHIDIMQFYGK